MVLDLRADCAGLRTLFTYACIPVTYVKAQRERSRGSVSHVRICSQEEDAVLENDIASITLAVATLRIYIWCWSIRAKISARIQQMKRLKDSFGIIEKLAPRTSICMCERMISHQQRNSAKSLRQEIHGRPTGSNAAECHVQ